MFYVYAKHIKTGKVQMVNSIYDTVEDAIKKIAANYKIDKDLGQLGEYEYFYNQR